MLPPTPTLLPPGAPIVFVPESYSIWASAPYAIQSWNMTGDNRLVFQALILLAIIIAGAYILIRFKRDFTRKDSEE